MTPLEAAYLEAAIPEPVILLGQKLEPYSLGHEMLRRRYAQFSANGVFDVYVCCQRYEEGLANLRNPQLARTIHAWRRKLGAYDPLAVSLSFESYRRAGSQCPKFKRIKRGSRSPYGAPWLLALLQTLMGPLNQSWSDAHNCPYGHAQWLYCAYWEAQGNICISTESEQDLWARIVAAAREHGLEPLRLGPRLSEPQHVATTERPENAPAQPERRSP